MNCKICNNLGYVFDKNERMPCFCQKLKKLMAYTVLTPSLFRLTEEDRDFLTEKFSQPIDKCFVTFKGNVSEHYVNSTILYFLLSHNQPAYHILNVYELIEIYLSRHPDVKSLFDLKFPACILLEGYSEFPNIRQNDAILQFLEILRRNNSKVLYISRKASNSIILNYVLEQKWILYDWGKSTRTRYEAA